MNSKIECVFWNENGLQRSAVRVCGWCGVRSRDLHVYYTSLFRQAALAAHEMTTVIVVAAAGSSGSTLLDFLMQCNIKSIAQQKEAHAAHAARGTWHVGCYRMCY
jgi:hypothetical protein